MALTIPAPIAREVNFEADADVNIRVENGTLIINRVKTRRTLKDFLAECDLTVPPSKELLSFDAAPRAGEELI